MISLSLKNLEYKSLCVQSKQRTGLRVISYRWSLCGAELRLKTISLETQHHYVLMTSLVNFIEKYFIFNPGLQELQVKIDLQLQDKPV